MILCYPCRGKRESDHAITVVDSSISCGSRLVVIYNNTDCSVLHIAFGGIISASKNKNVRKRVVKKELYTLRSVNRCSSRMLSPEIVHNFVYISYKDMYTFLVPKRPRRKQEQRFHAALL